MHNIYLIGMMGSGKTSTGKALAKLIGIAFADLDEEIEHQTHLSVNEIFSKKGEPYFRTQEKKILNETAKQNNLVVATGGGIVLDPENVEKMKKTGRIIYLSASFETLWNRVQHKMDRPLLAVKDPKATLHQLFQIRSPLYENSTEERIETDGLTPEAVAKKIFEQNFK